MVKDYLFSFFFFLGILIISIIFLPSFFMPQKIVIIGGKLMGYWTSICLRLFLSTEILVKGHENIIKNEKFFIASSHQSMFETFFLQTIFNSPVFILKKELLLIPIFGWYLKKIGSISITRNKISRDNLGFLDKILKTVSNLDRPIIIFPQGTRVLPYERPPLKKGAARIYEKLNIACQPIAINSGNVWPKKGMKTPGQTITVSILPKIKKGIESKEFLKKLEEKIYSELDLIN